MNAMPIDLEAIRTDNAERDVPNPYIDALIAEVKRLTRWIPVTERLPETGTWFVGVIVSEEIDFNTRLPKVTTRMLRGYPNYALDPEMTHWMPLPEPPPK